MFLVLYVCGMGLRVVEKDGVPSINGAIGSGLIVSTIVWCLGNISGAHINPAVSIAFLFTGKMNPLATIFYIGFQLLGALTGSYILRDLVPEFALSNLSLTEIHPELSLQQAFGVEFIITFILILTVFSCVDENRNDIHGSFPLTIGLAIVVGSLFGGPFTGGSMNPARSFGPAVVMNQWKDHWIYWVGPISGGIVAGILYKFILTRRFLRRRSNVKSLP
jgi:MIP family channel proteins